MKNGVPFKLAFGDVQYLTQIEKAALSIKFSEFEGSKFNYEVFEFERSEDR